MFFHKHKWVYSRVLIVVSNSSGVLKKDVEVRECAGCTEVEEKCVCYDGNVVWKSGTAGLAKGKIKELPLS